MTQAVAMEAPAARGVLLEKSDQQIVLGVPGTEYRLHLKVDQPLPHTVGKRVSGRIYASARRVDVARAGGRLIEPVYGRPRRVQGRVIAVSEPDQTLTVLATVPLTCKLLPHQQAGAFREGMMVTFDVEPGARFVPDGA